MESGQRQSPVSWEASLLGWVLAILNHDGLRSKCYEGSFLDKQLSLGGILLSSLIFVPSLWIVSVSFVASPGLLDLETKVAMSRAPGSWGLRTEDSGQHPLSPDRKCPIVVQQSPHNGDLERIRIKHSRFVVHIPIVVFP